MDRPQLLFILRPEDGHVLMSPLSCAMADLAFEASDRAINFYDVLMCHNSNIESTCSIHSKSSDDPDKALDKTGFRIVTQVRTFGRHLKTSMPHPVHGWETISVQRPYYM